jgi:hypothetical protein
MRKLGLAVLPFLTFASTVWFPVENSNSNVPSLWTDGFKTGYEIGYDYCLVDKEQISKLERKLRAINILLENLKRFKGVKDNGQTITITITIPKSNPSLVRLANRLKRLAEKKEKYLTGWLVYCNCLNYPEEKIGWYIRQAEKLGYDVLKVGKVIFFDAKANKADAEFEAKQLSQTLGIPVKVVYVR